MNAEARRNQLMKDMAQLRLQAEVNQLEGSLQSSDTKPNLPPYLVTDAPSLCDHLPLIRQLASSSRFIIIIPLAGEWNNVQEVYCLLECWQFLLNLFFSETLQLIKLVKYAPWTAGYICDCEIISWCATQPVVVIYLYVFLRQTILLAHDIINKENSALEKFIFHSHLSISIILFSICWHWVW